MKYTPKELQDNVNISNSSSIKEFFTLLSGLLGLGLLVYVALGFAVDFVVPKLPYEVEEQLGDFFSAQYKDIEKTIAGDKLQELLDSMPKEFSREQKQFTVHLFPSKEFVNAWAVPGRNIVVSSALIREVDSENELVFILAHELGHFANKDHLRGLGRGLVLTTMAIVLFGQDNSVSNFFMNSMGTVEMKFSQSQERAADIWALELLNKKYGHVAGATDFFARIAEKNKDKRFLYYFASHPHPDKRIKALKEQIKAKKYLLKEKTPLDDVFKGISDSKATLSPKAIY